MHSEIGIEKNRCPIFEIMNHCDLPHTLVLSWDSRTIDDGARFLRHVLSEKQIKIGCRKGVGKTLLKLLNDTFSEISLAILYNRTQSKKNSSIILEGLFKGLQVVPITFFSGDMKFHLHMMFISDMPKQVLQS